MRKKIEKSRLCFGTRISRDRLLPVNPRPRDYPGPFEYYHPMGLLKKFANKSGYTLLASKIPRDKFSMLTESHAPPIGTYDIDYRRDFTPMARPFLVGSKRGADPKFLTPAPGTYNFFKRQERVCTAFMHDKIRYPLVEIICSPFNRAYCWKCEKTPVGDYWHRKCTNQDLCRPCMEQKIAELKKCDTKMGVRLHTLNDLKKYTLTRYCGFYHEHNCTKAAIQIMETKDLIFKLRKENYLASFGL